MKSIYLLSTLMGIFLFTSCSFEGNDDDHLLLDPVDYVYHDAFEGEVEDSLTQLAIDVRIVGWKKNDRSFYSLHYKFSKKEEKTAIEEGNISYDDIRVQSSALLQSFLFTELDSVTEYKLELQSTYFDQLTSDDVYLFSTKGDTTSYTEE